MKLFKKIDNNFVNVQKCYTPIYISHAEVITFI